MLAAHPRLPSVCIRLTACAATWNSAPDRVDDAVINMFLSMVTRRSDDADGALPSVW